MSDNFDRANSTTLGGSWVEDSGQWQIDTNTLFQSLSSGAYRKCRWNATFNDNQYSEADLTPLNGAVGVAVFVRGATSSTVTYYGYIFFGGDASYIVEITAGSESILATGGSASLSTTYTNARLEASSSSLTATRNGSADISTTDATLTTGQVGIAQYGGNSSRASSGYMDNWSGGSLSSDQTITGALYSDSDTFPAGTITTAYTITGALYSDSDTFPAGTISTSYTITGALFTDSDTFPSGTITPGEVAITGALYSDSDTFYAGTISQGGAEQNITGALFSDSDTFPSGTISTAYTITGALFTDSDTFPSGTISTSYTITGRTVTPTGFALQFMGNGVNDIDRVKIPIDRAANDNPLDVGGNFTIEAWIAPTADNDAAGISQGSGMLWVTGNIFIDRDTNGNGDYGDYGLSLANGRVAFGVGVGASSYTIVGTTDLRDDEWHHVAVTRNTSTGAMVLYVDGAQEASGTGPTGDASYRDGRSTSYPDDPYLVLGAEKHDFDPVAYPPYYGLMQDLRVSDTIRYTGTFDPPRILADDADTVGLYLFDEGSGTTLGDSATQPDSPTDGTINVGGSPSGPNWVSSDLVYNFFGSGVITFSQNIAGALVTDPDTFYAGTITPGGVSITGALFTDADTFPSGTITTSYQITGALFSDADTFPAGSISTSYQITGALFQDSDSFYAGTLTPGEVTITGALFSDSDTFYSGEVTLAGYISGSLFVDPDTFYAGTITPGGVSITGALFTDSDSFYSGSISQAGGDQSIIGAIYTDPDSIYAGEITTSYTITGAILIDPDSFYVGTITTGGVTITGAIYTDPDSFYAGAIAGVGLIGTVTLSDSAVFTVTLSDSQIGRVVLSDSSP